jgi:multidrug efflux pump subunit AcrB
VNLSHFFVDRPIFATVLSVFVIIVGAAAYFTLPVAQYPEIAPPTIVVTASYPGASAEVVSDTVSTPLEQEINGVENMLYMISQATADGNLQLTITFALGTDLDISQVLVQNRVSIAEPKLPEEVRRLGITVKKNSPDMLMVIHLSSPDGSRDQLYISNYATLQISRRPRASAPFSLMSRHWDASPTRASSPTSLSEMTRTGGSRASATSAASSSAPRITAPTATSTSGKP